MARIPDNEIERLKKEVALERLVLVFGVELKRHGAELLGRCPFHEDKTPCLVVSPKTNLWHCLGKCNVGGSTIDWVMRTKGVSFRHAVELLKADYSSLAAGEARVVKKGTTAKLDAPVKAEADDQEALRQLIAFYHETLKESPEALRYLESRGLTHPEMIGHFRIGFSSVADAEDGYGLAVFVEADAVVADAKAELGRVDALQALHIADAGFGEALDRLLDAAGDALIETGHVGQSRTGPCDLHLLQSEPPHRFCMRNALAAVVLEPGLSFGDSGLLFVGFRLVVERRAAQGRRHRIDDGFEELHQAGKLRLRYAVNQLVGVLAGVAHRGEPPPFSAKRRSAALTVLRRTMLSITERMTLFSAGFSQEAAPNGKRSSSSRPRSFCAKISISALTLNARASLRLASGVG